MRLVETSFQHPRTVTTANLSFPIFDRWTLIVVQGICHLISQECCKEGAEVCEKCSLHKGSALCCKLGGVDAALEQFDKAVAAETAAPAEEASAEAEAAPAAEEKPAEAAPAAEEAAPAAEAAPAKEGE